VEYQYWVCCVKWLHQGQVLPEAYHTTELSVPVECVHVVPCMRVTIGAVVWSSVRGCGVGQLCRIASIWKHAWWCCRVL